MSNTAATVDILRKARIVNKIAIHIIIITISPANNALKPKNIGDHKAFRNNCTPKIIRAVLT